MARGRTRRPPSVRNLELYHDFLCEHKKQAQIAAEAAYPSHHSHRRREPRVGDAVIIQIDNPNSNGALIVVLRRNDI